MTKSEERAEGIDGKRPESAAIEHPSYYNQGIEVIDFVDSYGLNFNLGNVVKYVVRAGHKPGEEAVEALSKAVWYLEHEIARRKELEGKPF